MPPELDGSDVDTKHVVVVVAGEVEAREVEKVGHGNPPLPWVDWIAKSTDFVLMQQ